MLFENGNACRRHQDQLRKRADEADDIWTGDRSSTDVAAEDQETLNEDVGDRPEIEEEIEQEAHPTVIVQPEVNQRRYPSRDRRQTEHYQARFS